MFTRLVFLGLCLCWLVRADTEIRNFHLPLAGKHVSPTGPVVTYEQHQLELVISDKVPELWVALDAADGAWTTRISWPAYMPTRFDMGVSPSKDSAVLHIRARPLSPRMRHPLLERFGWGGSKLSDDEFETTFHLVLEPLLLGVIPQTAWSAIAAIVVMVSLAIVAVPYVLRALDRVIAQVDKEEKLEGKIE